MGNLVAQLYVDVRDNEFSRFIKVGKRPARFFLKERSGEITETVAAKIEKAGERPPKTVNPTNVRAATCFKGYVER